MPDRPTTEPSGAGSAVDASGDGIVSRRSRRIPEATVARLPVYLRSLVEVAETNTVTISSERLA